MNEDLDDSRDRKLVERIVAGDMSAFSTLVEVYQRYVAAIVRRHVPIEVVEDIAQGSFLEIYKSIGSYRGESKFKSWMTRIVLRQCYAHWKRDARKLDVPFSSLNTGESEWLDAVFSGTAKENFSQQESRAHARKVLEVALGRLNAEDRFIVVAILLEEQKYDDVAKVLNWSARRLRVRVHRAKKRLAAVIEEVLS